MKFVWMLHASVLLAHGLSEQDSSEVAKPRRRFLLSMPEEYNGVFADPEIKTTEMSKAEQEWFQRAFDTLEDPTFPPLPVTNTLPSPTFRQQLNGFLVKYGKWISIGLFALLVAMIISFVVCEKYRRVTRA